MAELVLFLVACAPSMEQVADKQAVQERVQSPIPLGPDAVRANRDALAVRLHTDPDPAVRAEIASALGFVAHDEHSIPALTTALRTEQDAAVQRRLVAVLLSFNVAEAIEPVVVFWLRGPPPEIERDVESGLAGADPRLVTAALEANARVSPERAARLRVAPL